VSQSDLEGKNAEFTTPEQFIERTLWADKVLSV
jgi:hypothetical protein